MAVEGTETLPKVERLLKKYETTKSENEFLHQELSKTQEALAQARNQIDDLTKQYNRLRLARAYAASDEQKREAISHITKLVREIDSCLSLLKKND